VIFLGSVFFFRIVHTFLGAFIGCYVETKDIQYSSNVANYFSYVSVQQNNACLKFASLHNTKNAAKAAFL
jgi:hypothetical protein